MVHESATQERSARLSEAGTDVAVLRLQVVNLPSADDEAGLIDQISELERLKAAAAARQVQLTQELDERRAAILATHEKLAETRNADRPPNPDSGLGMEIGLARRESPYVGRGKLLLARRLRHLPETFAALQRGDLSERRAEIIANETKDLTPTMCRDVDAVVCKDLSGLGDADLRDATRREVLRLDEEAFLQRRERARAQRRVTTRVLADGMTQVTAIIDSMDATALVQSLDRVAEQARAAGDDRTRAQLFADVFVQHLIGPGVGQARSVALKLLVSAETLLADNTEPGYLIGHGYIPASVARELAYNASQALGSTLQRLFHNPEDGALLAMESTQSFYQHALGDFLMIRDRRCRTPYCDAPIRHRDHVVARSRGGTTSSNNGQGLCQACNYAKENPGWRQRPLADPLATTTIDITTPTGHRHRSRAPAAPMATERISRAELFFTRLVLSA